ncbi:MAG: thioredoxin [Bacteroidales bacterium]
MQILIILLESHLVQGLTELPKFKKNDMSKVEHLTEATFKEKVFDFDNNTDWKFEGTLPCLIDFYADWCGPCKIVAPILEELQKEYDGKLNIYKIDTESERNLAGMFGIQSIPSLLFVPLDQQPQMAVGALSKEQFRKAIADVLNVSAS